MIKAETLSKWREFVNKRRHKKTLKYKRKRIIRIFKDNMLTYPDKMGWRVFYNAGDYDDDCETVIQMFGEIFTKKKGYDILIKGITVDGDCNVYIRMGKIEDPENISDSEYYTHCIDDFT